MEVFPTEIIRQVLQYVPLRDKFVCRRVCRRWKDIAESVLDETDRIWFVYQSWTDFLPICEDQRHHVTDCDKIVCNNIGDKEFQAIERYCQSLTVIVFDHGSVIPHSSWGHYFTEFVRANCNTLECLTESNDTGFSYVPPEDNDDHFCLPNLRHIYAHQLDKHFLESTITHPQLEIVFTNHVFDLDLSNLPPGLRVLRSWDGKWVTNHKVLEEFVDIAISSASNTLETLGPLMIQAISNQALDADPFLPQLKHLELYIDNQEAGNEIIPFVLDHCPSLRHLTLVGHFGVDKNYLRTLLIQLPHLESIGLGCDNASAETISSAAQLLPNDFQLYPTFQSLRSDFLHSLIPVLANVHNFEVHIQASVMDTCMLRASDILSFVETAVIVGSLRSFKIIFESPSDVGFRFTSLEMERLRELGHQLSYLEIRKHHKKASLTTLMTCYLTQLQFVK